MRSLVCLILLSLSAAASASESFLAAVVGVSDGDTIKVMHEGRSVSVRLFGIDCPERKQPFGSKARQFTSGLVFGESVKLIVRGKNFDRLVADVILPDGRVLNQEIVRAGYGWWFTKYAPNDRTLERLEREARKAGRGLWAVADPVAPWHWRKR